MNYILLSRMEKYLYALRVWSRNIRYCKRIRLLPDIVNSALSFAEYDFVILCYVGIIYL